MIKISSSSSLSFLFLIRGFNGGCLILIIYSVVILRFPPALLLKTSFAVDIIRYKSLYRALSKAGSKLEIGCIKAEAVKCLYISGIDEDLYISIV
jgi:hypothetical protein